MILKTSGWCKSHNLVINAALSLGVDDGAWTHDNRNHNPGLYQLSYAHHGIDRTSTTDIWSLCARLAGFEPATLGLEGRCSIQMSYRRKWLLLLYHLIQNDHIFSKKHGRGRGIRTPDILLPKQARYQAALYPVMRDHTDLLGDRQLIIVEKLLGLINVLF